jgi:hypothetical protein
MTRPCLVVPLAITSGLFVAGTHASPLSTSDKGVAVVVVERAERCAPVSPAGLPKHPKSKGYVFLQLEVGGRAAQDPRSLNADTVVLRSGSSRWRPESVAIGVPAGDPLGVWTRGPLLLFQVPRDIRHFSLKVGKEPEVPLEADRVPRDALICY